MLSNKQLGQQAENCALDFLKAQGFQIIEHNYQSRLGEIDIIARQQNLWIFVEVKYRQSSYFGGAEHALRQSQMKRIINSASMFLKQRQLNIDQCEIRFDVILLEGQAMQLEWIPGAFGE